jgi:hypothetical protein
VTVEVSSKLVNLVFAYQFAGGSRAGIGIGKLLILTASEVR